MYTKEEIYQEFNDTSDSGERYFLIAHLMTEVILKEPLENSTEEEYFEGLIFTSFFIAQSVPHQKEKERNEILKSMYLGLWRYAMEVDDLLDIVDDDILNFFSDRYRIIGSEINKMNSDPNYMIPFLLNNLYLNPLNKEKYSTHEIMDKLDPEEIIKGTMLFKIKYKHFLTAFKETMQLLQSQ